MSSGFKSFLQRWLITTLAVCVACQILGDARIHAGSWRDLLFASLLLGILNAVLRPLMLLLSLPLLIFTLGLFTLVINAALLWLVGRLLQPNFSVASFKWAFWGAFIISLVSLILNSLTKTGNARISVQRGPSTGNKPGPGDGDGPVIDV